MARFIRQPLPPPLPLRFLSKEDIERLLKQARRERQVPPPAPPPPPPPSGEFPTELFRRQQTGQPGPQPAPPPSMVAQDIAELERLYGPEAVREFGEVAARGLNLPFKAVGTVGLKAAALPSLVIPPSQRTPELQRAAEFAAAGPRESWRRYEEQPWAAQMIAETPAFFPGKSVRAVSQLGKLVAEEVPKVARKAVPVVQRGLAGEAGFVRIPGGKIIARAARPRAMSEAELEANWQAMSYAKRLSMVEEAGIDKELASKNWAFIPLKDQSALSKRIAVPPSPAVKEPWQMTKTVWEEENAVEAPSSYLYHGTPRKNLEKIRREGLQSKTRQRNDWEEGDRTPKMQELLYFERKPNKGWGGKGAVQLRVNEDMLPKGVDIKEDVLRSGEYYTYSFKNDYYEIPPEAIEYLEEKTGKWISLIDDPHKAAVRLALAKGKPVPAEVLADYPGLVARVPGTAPPVPPAAPEAARAAEAVAPRAAGAIPEAGRPPVKKTWKFAGEEPIEAATPQEAQRILAERKAQQAVQPPVEPGVAKPVPGRAEAPPAPPSAGGAMPPPAVRAEVPPTIPPAEPPIKPPVGEGRPPVEPPLDPKEIVKEWTGQIKAAKKLRGPTAEAISKERARRKAIIEAQLQRKRGPEARRAAFGAAKGEIPTPMFEPASAVFSGEKAELLQEMIRAHFEKDAYRYLPAQTAFDKLFLGGRIPTPSELAVLEEVFGSDLIRAVLSQRAAGTKAWELFLEMWNVPKALKASFDLSGTLRQGAYLLLEGNPAKEALIAELKAVRSEAGFKAVNEAIASNKWYEFSQSLGRNSLDLTLPRVARGIVGREEPYIGARLVQRIPLIGKGVRISERAYTAFLNKIRMESFAREAEILSAKGAPRETFEKLAWNINVMSGRGSLGRFTQASAILNLPFFSPRFAVSRFQLPLTLATRNPQLLKMALRDVVGYISSVFALEALLDMAGVAEIEWNPLSSDFGKIRIGKTRIDPFAGFQQPVVLVAQLLAGKRKRLESGRMIEIDPTQRVSQFVESKLGPSASLNLALRRGKLFGGKELTPVNALYELLMPIPITDIWEAAIGGSGGLADSIMEGGGYGALGTLGMGIQTFGIGVDWSKELKPYLDIPSNPVELLVENQKRAERGEKPLPTREKYREDNSEADAKLFILGETTAFETKDARQEAERLIVENKIDPRQIKGIKARIETLEEYEALNREYRARRQPTKAPPKNVQVDALLKSLGVYPSHVPAPSPRLPLSPIPTPGFQPLKPISPIPTPGFQPLKPMTREEAEELLRSLQTPVPAGVR